MKNLYWLLVYVINQHHVRAYPIFALSNLQWVYSKLSLAGGHTSKCSQPWPVSSLATSFIRVTTIFNAPSSTFNQIFLVINKMTNSKSLFKSF